jgi:CRP-like cAMP-binding protein
MPNGLHPRTVPCEQCPLRAMSTFRPFTAEELQFVSEFKAGEIHAKAGETIFEQGSRSDYLFTLLRGWTFRYKTLADGGRQILNFVFPGDFLGLQGSTLDEMQHSAEALTNVVLCAFPRDKLWELYSHFPGLAFDVTWLASRSEQMLDENLTSLGRRTSLQRLAYLLLHLYVRAEETGLAEGGRAAFPFTQQHVADTLGMSLVHTNKTLKRLAMSGTMRWRDRTFELIDRDGLAALGMYETGRHQKYPLI